MNENARETNRVGMWIFLATEVMLFGGLFAAYTVYRFLYPAAFAAAGARMDVGLGILNTAILLISSLTMALAVQASEPAGSVSTARRYLVLTMCLGGLFLGIKALEYAHHVRDHLLPGAGFVFGPGGSAPGIELFFCLYFVMTGLHAVHMVAGLALIGALAMRSRSSVEMVGLYWHFIDVIWIFLFPLFYLVGGR